MIALDYTQAHAFVEKQSRRSDVRWDGWDIVFWRANPNGYSMRNGAYRNGRWGVQTRIKPNSRGVWLVSEKNVSNRRTRPGPR